MSACCAPLMSQYRRLLRGATDSFLCAQGPPLSRPLVSATPPNGIHVLYYRRALLDCCFRQCRATLCHGRDARVHFRKHIDDTVTSAALPLNTQSHDPWAMVFPATSALRSTIAQYRTRAFSERSAAPVQFELISALLLGPFPLFSRPASAGKNAHSSSEP